MPEPNNPTMTINDVFILSGTRTAIGKYGGGLAGVPPCDLASVVDYTHLTAMLAPRASLLTFNDKDDCCFESGYALPPLPWPPSAWPLFRPAAAASGLAHSRYFASMSPPEMPTKSMHSRYWVAESRW